MSKKISLKEIRQAALTMKAKQFMKIYGESNQLEIYDADNLLNYNEGSVNLKFSGAGQTDLYILFVDGKCHSIQSFVNMAW
jgi:hypothetical protein